MTRIAGLGGDREAVLTQEASGASRAVTVGAASPRERDRLAGGLR